MENEKYILILEKQKELYYRTIDINGNFSNVKMVTNPRNKKKKKKITPYYGIKI